MVPYMKIIIFRYISKIFRSHLTAKLFIFSEIGIRLKIKPNNVVGFIFNRMPISLEDDIKKLCSQMGTEYFGYIPKNNDFHIGSRHLGLITADEIEDLNDKLKMLSDQIK